MNWTTTRPLLGEAARAAGARIEYQRQGYCTGRYYDLRP